MFALGVMCALGAQPACQSAPTATWTPTPAPFPQAKLRLTNQPLDLAVDNANQPWPYGYDYLVLKTTTGQTIDTLSESFVLGAQGQLATKNGEVLFPPITVPTGAEVHVNPTGSVVAHFKDKGTTDRLGQIMTARIVSPFLLQPFGPGRLLANEASGDPQLVIPGTRFASKLIQGYLDDSHP
jgi:flagellar basal-body rod protein FlgG